MWIGFYFDEKDKQVEKKENTMFIIIRKKSFKIIFFYYIYIKKNFNRE